MRVLVLGGYGLIGSAVCRRLQSEGHDVVALGRSAAKAKRVLPDTEFITCDIATMTFPQAWRHTIDGFDAIVNASGVLQDGSQDSVCATQRDAIVALVSECKLVGSPRFIQISAPGASHTSNTVFFKSKAAADDAVAASGLPWTILRPGLVISEQSYGGTTLLRMLASFPRILPIALYAAPIQTVSVHEVTEAVVQALNGKLDEMDVDVLEEKPHSLETVVTKFRDWLGFAKPSSIIRMPALLAWPMVALADLAGWLGWRPALRSTSFKVLALGVHGNPGPYRDATGREPAPLDDSLKSISSTVQERVFARSQLVYPVLLLTLSLFWIVSGAIGFARSDQAAAILTESGFRSAALAKLSVFLGSLADVTVGAFMLWRRFTKPALIASVLLAMGYLVAGSLTTPELWADPLGAFVKVFPAIGLAIAVWSTTEDR